MIARGERAGPLVLLRRRLRRRLASGLVGGRRERPGREAHRRHAEPLGDLAGAVAELERPHRVGRRARAACRPSRSAPATRSARSRRRPRRASARAARPCRPAGRSGRARCVISLTEPVPGSTSTTCVGSSGSAEAWVAVIIACPTPAMRAREDPPAAGVELGEDVVEQQERRRRAGSSASASSSDEDGESLLALRAELPQVAVAARDEHVVEVRAEPRRSALDVAGEPRLERSRRRRRRRRTRAGRPAGRARRRAPRTPAPSARASTRRSSTSVAPSAATRSVHGSSAARSERRRAAPAAAPRCAARARRRSPAARRRGPGAARPSTRSKYARRAAGPPLTTASRSGVKTSVESSRRSDSAEGSRAPFSRASFACPCRSVTVASTGDGPRRPATDTRAAVSPKRISWPSWRVRGEKPCVARWSDSSRFVLPTPLRPTTRTTPAASVEVERRVRPVLTERYAIDDQPARRIGMIRYT